METLDCIMTRRSIRRFEDKPVDEKLIHEIIGIASYAPSWKNSQTVRYFVVADEDIKNRIADEATGGFDWNSKIIKGAPVVIVLITINGRSGFEKDGSFSTSKGTHWQSFDAGLSAQNLCLCAHEKGLGSVILGIYEEEKVQEILGLEEDELVSAIIPIGYPAEEPSTPKRKPINEIIM